MNDNGKKTSCYDIPKDAITLDDLIEHKNMKFWQGNIIKAIYALQERSTRNESSNEERELNKIIYYANRRLDAIRLEQSKELNDCCDFYTGQP